MTEVQSHSDASALSSSMDSTYTRQSGRPELPAARLHEMLRRAKSDGYQSRFQLSRNSIALDQNERKKAENETSPPIRANSKRRRSVGSTPGPKKRHRSFSYTSNPTPLHSQRDSQDRGSSSPNNPYFSRSSTASSDPESLPRGRARRRDDHVVDGSPTVRKGAFRLHKYRRPDEFCFPKSRSQPEPIWRPGDGFSDEEARTPMMLKRKRKRSHSLTGLGQLPLESKSTGEDNIESTGLSQRKAREKPRELWPTRDNFLEIPILKKIRKDAVESSVAEPTTVPTTINQTTSKSRGKQVVPRKRQISDFENFGRRRRKSQSRPRRTPSSSFMGIQRNIVQTSHDSACAEDYNSSSEQAGDGHTERYATSEEPDYIFEMSGSLELGGEADSWDLLIDESDDSDGSADPDTDATEDRIQGTVPDSQVEFD